MTSAGQSLAELIRTACLVECTARKPGNVHPGATFDDLRYTDFVKSANAAAPILARASALGVGPCVLEAVRATRDAVGKNTNLGIVLLIAPLAAVDASRTLRDGIPDVLNELTIRDAELAYQAIRLADAGGMGRVETGDVSAAPTGMLREMMRLAAERDSIAAQYAGDFHDVLTWGVDVLLQTAEWFPSRWEDAVVRLHLEIMARIPDTLIARKCGVDTSAESANRAQAVLDAGWPSEARGRESFANLDRWLRADGHRRNPGTTADLVTAVLFATFREGKLPLLPASAIDIVCANRRTD